MSEKDESKVEEEKTEDAVPEVVLNWQSHFVIHIELKHPIQMGEHKRSYRRMNTPDRKPTIDEGIMEVDCLGMPRYYVPLDNVVDWQISYIWVPDFEGGQYVPTPGFLEADQCVGCFYLIGDDPETDSIIGVLNEESQVSDFRSDM